MKIKFFAIVFCVSLFISSVSEATYFSCAPHVTGIMLGLGATEIAIGALVSYYFYRQYEKEKNDRPIDLTGDKEEMYRETDKYNKRKIAVWLMSGLCSIVPFSLAAACHWAGY